MTDETKSDGRELYVLEFLDQDGRWTILAINPDRQDLQRPQPDERVTRYVPDSHIVAAKLAVLDELHATLVADRAVNEAELEPRDNSGEYIHTVGVCAGHTRCIELLDRLRSALTPPLPSEPAGESGGKK